MKGKKILLLMTNLVGGGADRVALHLGADWSRQGAEVVVATLASAAEDAYAIPAGVRRVALGFSGKRGSLADLLRNNIMPVLAVRRLLQEEKPDIVVGVTVVGAVALALAAGLMRRRDGIFIGAEHGHTPADHYGRIWEIARRYGYGRLDAVVALTEKSGDWLREHTRARRVAVIANAVVMPVADSGTRLEVGDVVGAGRKILLAGGRLVEQKGFDRLLAAFAQVAGRYVDWRLVILGEGELRGALEAQVRALGLGERVCLPGRAGNVAEWYRAADGFVLASRFEGFPMVLVEAMAHGCAVVSVDCDTGPGDIIRDGVDGLLVAQDDSGALAGGLERLMGDEGLRARLGARAVEVCERFAPQRIRGQWWGLFEEELAARRGHGRQG